LLQDPWLLILVYEKDDGRKMMTAYKLAELTFATDDDKRRQQFLDRNFREDFDFSATVKMTCFSSIVSSK